MRCAGETESIAVDRQDFVVIREIAEETKKKLPVSNLVSANYRHASVQTIDKGVNVVMFWNQDADEPSCHLGNVPGIADNATNDGIDSLDGAVLRSGGSVEEVRLCVDRCLKAVEGANDKLKNRGRIVSSRL